MLTLVVPILIGYLLEGHSLATANKLSLALHDASLQWLRKIGPKYPQVKKNQASFYAFVYIPFYVLRNSKL